MTGATTSIAFPPKQFIDDGPDYAEDDPAFSDPIDHDMYVTKCGTERTPVKKHGTEWTERTEFKTGGRGESDKEGVRASSVFGKSQLLVVWNLARKLKSTVKNATLIQLKPMVEKWHANSKLRNIDFFEVWDEFEIAFDASIYPIGVNIAHKAAEYPRTAPRIGRDYPPDIQTVMNLCFTLASGNPDRVFWLAVREPERMKLPINKSKVARIMRRLVKDKVIVKVKEGKRGPEGVSPRYKWIGTKF